MRKIMAIKLISYYAIRPWKFKELYILYHFRLEREKRAGYEGTNLEEEQYNWCALKLNEEVTKVKEVVNRWIFNIPITYLKNCVYPGVNFCFDSLRRKGIKTAVYSDYNVTNKLLELGIETDFQVSSTDIRVNSFKPLPKALNIIVDELGITNRDNCLFIGDRLDLDGACAQNAGIPFLLINKKKALTSYYSDLLSALISS